MTEAPTPDERQRFQQIQDQRVRRGDYGVGPRWQAEMEDFLSIARERVHVAARITIPPEGDLAVAAIAAHAAVAQAAATAALVLAISNTGGDVEQQLSNIYHAIAEGT